MLGARRNLGSGTTERRKTPAGEGRPRFARAGRQSPAITLTALTTTALAAAAPAAAFGEQGGAVAGAPPRPAPEHSGHVEANGVSYYYEIHGRGEPLLLLHGGLGSLDMFGPVLPALAAGRQVIAVDLHGHGRTALGDRPLSLMDMGDDLAAVLTELGYAQADVLGYSLGGGVAFRLAVQHPQKVRRLVLVSAAYARDGFYPDVLAQQAQMGAAAADAMKGTPMYQGYVAVAPKPEDFPRLLDQMGKLLATPYDWADDVKKLRGPVMLVYGDSDMYRPEHVIEFYKLLGGGLRDAGWMRENMSPNRLAILPGRTHYDIFFAPELVATVLPFLNGESRAADWADQMRR